MADQANVKWMTVEATDMPKHLQAAWTRYRETADTERRKFEDAFTADARKSGAIPDGKALAFGYKWGKLSVAIVDPAKSAATPKFSFGKTK